MADDDSIARVAIGRLLGSWERPYINIAQAIQKHTEIIMKICAQLTG